MQVYFSEPFEMYPRLMSGKSAPNYDEKETLRAIKELNDRSFELTKEFISQVQHLPFYHQAKIRKMVEAFLPDLA